MADDQKSARGRPEFEATEDLREKVEWYIATGMTQEEIARAIGCTVPTLVKHFSDNLDNAYSRKKAAVVDMMVETAKAGNASIQKRLEQIISTRGAMLQFDNPPPKPSESKAPPAAAPVGKKEMQAEAAKTAGAGTDWDSLLRPSGKSN